MLKKISCLLLLVTLFSCSENPTSNEDPPEQTINYTYSVVASLPHDRGAFTQGLVYRDNYFYEGTGLWGQSTLRKVDPATGNVLQMRELDDSYFGEGITIFEDKIYQLTWQSRKGFIYDYSSFDSLGQFTYTTEGWGLTHNGQQLIMSDGSANLYFINPDNMQIEKTIEVRDDYGPVSRLNELEYILGDIYANVWLSDYILIINPNTGYTSGRIDLTGLLDPEDKEPDTDVLNGIAFDPDSSRLFVTGKKWPKIFEIELVEIID